ncbi:MAG TPA: DNA replication and repair protein RecF [Gemmatimonadota bacterium]|nr:DNA replication and repair protein RecF [Gemmatimonadota bacterium]
MPVVRLTEVRIDGFRNLATTSLEVPVEGAILVGANGQGKTNFLEAIHFLSRFRSFRGTRHGDAIAFGAGHFRVEGGVRYRDGRSHAVAVAADGDRRRVTVDGAVVSRPQEVAGTLLAVTLRPEDLELVSGSPEARRAYVDELLALACRPYRRALSQYDRVLRQRNELLRGAGASLTQIEAWDEALIAAGAGLVVARARLVDRLADRFAATAARVAADGEAGEYEVEYAPSVPVDPASTGCEETVRGAWSRALVERYEVDRARGWTTVGPHRDDLSIRQGGRDLARYGSQGERRTAAVALRLMEAEVLEADTGQRPVLLLDDVFSELDEGRSERLLECLGERHQRFVTSPRPVPWLADGLARWTVAEGRIEAMTAIAAG